MIQTAAPAVRLPEGSKTTRLDTRHDASPEQRPHGRRRIDESKCRNANPRLGATKFNGLDSPENRIRESGPEREDHHPITIERRAVYGILSHRAWWPPRRTLVPMPRPSGRLRRRCVGGGPESRRLRCLPRRRRRSCWRARVVDRNSEGSDVCHRFGSRSTPLSPGSAKPSQPEPSTPTSRSPRRSPRRVRWSRRNRSRLSDADRQPRSNDERSTGEPPGRQRPLGRWAIMPVDRCLAGVAGNRRVLQIYFPNITNRCCDCYRGRVEYGYRSLTPTAAGVGLPQPARRPGRPEPDDDAFPGGATDDRPEPLLGPDANRLCGGLLVPPLRHCGHPATADPAAPGSTDGATILDAAVGGSLLASLCAAQGIRLLSLTLGDHTTATRPPAGAPATREQIELCGWSPALSEGNRFRALRPSAPWPPVRRIRPSRRACLPHSSHGQLRPPTRRPPASRPRGTFWGRWMCW